jgi:DNA-binding CsgD family transcriptional regulator
MSRGGCFRSRLPFTTWGWVVFLAEGQRGGVLLERDQELERIGRCLSDARQGRGGAVVVEGPAGIGKTMLLAAGRDAAEGEGFRVLRARGAELEREFAFGVVRQLVEPLVGAASREDRARWLNGPPGVAARLLGLPNVGEDFGPGTSVVPDPSFAVLHGLYWLCANLAAEQPLALVVDDAHWSDSASLRFLAFLLPRLEELRVAVLLGVRPAGASESGGVLAALIVDPATEVVTVRPLSEKAVADLVAAGLGAEPEPEFAQACWQATRGTPFMVGVVVAALREDRITPVAASATRIDRVATATLSSWARLRLLQLGPDAARLARAVAVMERAGLDQAAHLAGLAAADAADAAELLVRAGVLDEDPLCFAHPLLRGTIYRDMPGTQRAEAHGRAARFLAERHASPARIAEHLLGTVPAGDDWVVAQLQTAAREAAARGAPESAAVYLRRALAEPPAPEIEAGLLLELGLAGYNAGQPDWHDHLEAAVESASDDGIRIATALAFANVLALNQRVPEAVEVCDRLAARLDAHDTEGHRVLETTTVSFALMEATIASSFHDRFAALTARVWQGTASRQAMVMAARTAALANEPASQVADLIFRALAAGPRPLPEPDEPPWLMYGLTVLFFVESWTEAQTLMDAAVAEAQATANSFFLPGLLALRSWLAFRRGDLTAAEADGRASLDAIGLSGQPMIRNMAASALSETLVERGDLDEAQCVLESMATDLHGTFQTAAMVRHAWGRIRFARRRFGEALDDFRAVGEVAIATGAISPCFLPWRSDAALAALALGQIDTARQLGDEEVELARAFGAPRALGVALRAAGLVAGGQRGELLFREAIEVLEGPDTRLEQARAQSDLGTLLRRENHRVEAREPLRQALEAAQHVGADPLAHQADTELRATGAKPRRVLLTGLEALTASERRIAELAANGLTNREIAQTLFITGRTVEGHLTHIFGKLDVKARSALPAALSAPTQAVRSS